MSIEATRRMTFSEQTSRNPAFKGRGLAVEVRGGNWFGSRAADLIQNLPDLSAVKGFEAKFFTPRGIELKAEALLGRRTVASIDEMAARIDILSQVAAPRKFQIELPDMIDDPRLPFRIMRGELTAGQFLSAMWGHKIEPRKLQKILEISGCPHAALTNLNLLDQRAYVAEVEKRTGMRGMTVDEWNTVPNDVRDQMTGGAWFWTETETEPGSGIYWLCSLGSVAPGNIHPQVGDHDHEIAARLVADK